MAVRGLTDESDHVPKVSAALAEIRLDDYWSLPHTLTYGTTTNLAGTTTSRSVDSGAVATSAAQRTILGLPFKFNPPLHRTALPVRLDYTTGMDRSNDAYLTSGYLDERSLAAGANEVSALRGLRLGRIVQHEMASGMAATNDYRYGFRFLYNPTSVSIASSRNDSMILDPQSAVNAVVSGIDQNFQLIAFQLMLYRQPDVQSRSVTTGDYLPAISAADLDGIRRYGTHYDLEILYRVCNGVFNLDDRGRTSDIGMILPSNSRLLLGPGQNHFGFVQAISYRDLVFSSDMVPVRTEVDITFRRHVDMAPEDVWSLFDQSGSNQAAGTYTPVTAEWTLDTSKHMGGMFGAMMTGGVLGWLGEKIGDVLDPVLPGDQGKPNAPATPGGSVPNSSDAPVPGYNKVTGGWHYNSGGLHGAWDYGSGGINGKPIHCTQNGVIVRVKSMTTSYGNHVVVKSGNIYHYYAHMSKIKDGLAVGQNVVAGSHLGFVGSTGNSTGPHLHYEERENDKQYSRHPQWAVAAPGSKS